MQPPQTPATAPARDPVQGRRRTRRRRGVGPEGAAGEGDFDDDDMENSLSVAAIEAELKFSADVADPLSFTAQQVHVTAMRVQRDLGFHLSASFLCRKPQFNEPPEGLRPRWQVFLLPAPSVDALNHCSF